MFRIGSEIQQAFARQIWQDFVDETMDHMCQFAPEHTRGLGRDSVRAIIDDGAQRARSYGFTRRGPIRLYVEVMFTLGSDFDSDPQYPWATAALAHQGANEPEVDRARELYLATNHYLDVADGPSNEYFLAALERARAIELDLSFNGIVDINRQLLEILRTLGPEKARCVGEQRLQKLIQYGRSTAKSHDANTATEEALVVLLMFLLGHGCLTDKQFPWIARILSGHELSSAKKFVQLRNATMDYVIEAVRKLMKGRDISLYPLSAEGAYGYHGI